MFDPAIDLDTPSLARPRLTATPPLRRQRRRRACVSQPYCFAPAGSCSDFVLFAAAQPLSFSSTRWVVLAGVFLFAADRLGPHFLDIAIVSACMRGFIAAAAALLTADVLAREPSALLAGIGAGVREKLSPPYVFDVNTPMKISLEPGLPLLIAHLALFWRAERTAVQGALFVPPLPKPAA